MIRNASFRRFVIGLFLFTGLFSQFQAVFACELMGDGERTVCCCDEHGDKGCAMGGGCHDQQTTPDTDCCAVSYQSPPGSDAIVSDSHAQQVVLLEAPQPPPALLFSLSALNPPNPLSVLFGPTALPPGSPGNLTYLLTRRFRV
ncbi:MAG TPA: hypothetical protein ENI74_00025 [Gammaproteobacteria bacterium]|nr:hypothetical protein [Gammaproteobacteria bacterium]